MSAALPVIRGTSAALYPFTLTLKFNTIVGRFQNGQEQRSIGSPGGLISFELPYAQLTQAQKNVIQASVAAAKGQFDSTLTLTLGGTTYTNLQLDSDDFTGTEGKPTIYSAPLKVSQAITQNLSPGTPGLPFPALANGAMTILPFAQKQKWQTINTSVPAGPSYSAPEFGGGLTGYPTTGLMAWILSETMLTDADLATRMQHFIDNWGMAYAFQFKDETRAALNAPMTNITGADHAHFAVDPAMNVGQVIEIGPELMQVTGAYSAGAVPVTRAFAGSSSAAHSGGDLAAWVYLNAHYSTDSLSFRYNGVNNSDVTIQVEATNNWPN